jgi:hypothetical protein
MFCKKSPKKSCIKKSPQKNNTLKSKNSPIFAICSISFKSTLEKLPQLKKSLESTLASLHSSYPIEIKSIQKQQQQQQLQFTASIHTIFQNESECKQFCNKKTNNQKCFILSIHVLYQFIVPVYVPYFNTSIFNTTDSVLECNVNFSNLLYGLLEKKCENFKTWTDKNKTYFLDPNATYNTTNEEIIAFRGCEDVVKDKQVNTDFITSLKCFTSRCLEIDKTNTIYNTLKKAFGVWKDCTPKTK